MRRELILHVGAPKCGSTYLQQVLLRNRDRLALHGIAYIHDGGRHPGNGLCALDMTADRLDAAFDGHRRAVLSHEDLFSAAGRAQELARLCREGGIRVAVVAFLRPFSAFIYGDFSQFIKQEFENYLAERRAFGGRGFEQFAVDRSRILTCNAFLNGWRRLFGASCLTLAGHRNIRPVLESKLGVDDLDWTVPPDRTNPSIRMEDCDRIVAAINDRRVSAGDVRAMLRQALTRTGQPDAGKTAERTAWIEALFHAQNQALMSNFGFDNRLTKPGEEHHRHDDGSRHHGGDPDGPAQWRADGGRSAQELSLADPPELAPDRLRRRVAR